MLTGTQTYINGSRKSGPFPSGNSSRWWRLMGSIVWLTSDAVTEDSQRNTFDASSQRRLLASTRHPQCSRKQPQRNRSGSASRMATWRVGRLAATLILYWRTPACNGFPITKMSCADGLRRSRRAVNLRSRCRRPGAGEWRSSITHRRRRSRPNRTVLLGNGRRSATQPDERQRAPP